MAEAAASGEGGAAIVSEVLGDEENMTFRAVPMAWVQVQPDGPPAALPAAGQVAEPVPDGAGSAAAPPGAAAPPLGTVPTLVRLAVRAAPMADAEFRCSVPERRAAATSDAIALHDGQPRHVANAAWQTLRKRLLPNTYAERRPIPIELVEQHPDTCKMAWVQVQASLGTR